VVIIKNYTHHPWNNLYDLINYLLSSMSGRHLILRQAHALRKGEVWPVFVCHDFFDEPLVLFYYHTDDDFRRELERRKREAGWENEFSLW